MAHRINAINDEIQKCMSQLQSMKPGNGGYGFDDEYDRMLQAGKLLPLPAELNPAIIARQRIAASIRQTQPPPPAQRSGYMTRTKVPDLVDNGGWFLKDFGPIHNVSAVVEPNTGTPIYFKTAQDHALSGKVLECKPFNQWIQKMCTNSIVNVVVIQSVDMFGPRVGFLKFKAAVVDAEGTNVPSIVFMRGNSVAILLLIHCDDGKSYSVLTKQMRVPIGGFLHEIPAGMMDNDANFSGVAAKELKEETGIEINQSQLQDLTAQMYGNTDGVYPSCGGCDECMRIFLCELDMGTVELQKLQGKLTGELKEGEKITLVIVPFNELAQRAPDMKTLSALALYNAVKARSAFDLEKAQKVPFKVYDRSASAHKADTDPGPRFPDHLDPY